MHSFLSNILLSVRHQIWSVRTRPFCLLLKATCSTAQALSQDSIEAARNTARNAAKRAARRHRIATDPAYREREALRSTQKWQRRRDAHASELKTLYRTNLLQARTRKMEALIVRWHKSRRINEWSWKTHQPVRSPERTAHKCTACHRDRHLIQWWLEKPGASTKEFEKSHHTVEKPDDANRYMCNNCFVKDTERMLLERHPKKLPSVFTMTIPTPAEPDVAEDGTH